MQTQPTASPLPPSASRLQYFPVSFFAVVMGLAGLGIAWKRAEVVLALPFALSCPLEIVSVAAYAVIAAVYLRKLARFPGAVTKELRHPVRMNFFPTISIGLILLAILLAERYHFAAGALWALGSAMHLAFTLHVINVWLYDSGIEIGHVSPAWFIPVVGNVLVPIVGVRFAPAEISWFFFSIGIVFWMVLFTIVLYRLIFHAAMPERLMPTLFILVAPPAVSAIAYVAITGAVDAFARVLYHMALFLTLLLASSALRFLRMRFYLSAWAYSFPLAAVTIATLMMAKHTGSAGFHWLAWALLILLSAVVLALAVRTAKAVAAREICVEEG